jgi:hypothetical protein
VKRGAVMGRAAVGLVGVFALTFLGACPPQDLGIRIDAEGADRLVQACTINSDDSCHLPAQPGPPTPATGDATVAIKVFLVTKDFAVRDQSACAVLGYDFEDGNIDRAVLAHNLNIALDGAMPDGLTFDDFEDPDDAFVILAFYLDDTQSCGPDRLFACASLSNAIGESFNVDCGGCNGKEPAIAAACPNQGNALCPGATCFFHTCAALIGANMGGTCG